MRREIRPNQIARDPASVVPVGTFDGVHVGHQAVVRYLIERTEAQGGPATVLSFDPHPRTVLTGEEVSLLTTPAERADLLEDLGLDRFVLMPFTEEFS
ncbi:MAG: bifunctional riboflavin kinase/FAD synthetase, partial [Bacteroidetes bacterium QH_8_67_23]